MNQRINYALAGLVREKQPLIHCITNYVTAGDVANVILACGASPIMADHPEEAAEITAISNCLVLNMGTPGEYTREAMLRAGREANRLNLPIIFDPVGAGSSHMRNQMLLTILKEIKITVIRGNVSELKFLLNALTGQNQDAYPAARGVDAAFSDKITKDSMAPLIETARALSAMTGAVVDMTGTTDIVSTWKETWLVRNGCPLMSRITGSGCMLDGIIAAYTAAAAGSAGSAAPRHVLLEAAALATAASGLCGEMAGKRAEENHLGTGSFKCCFLDEVSLSEESFLRGGAKIEIR